MTNGKLHPPAKNSRSCAMCIYPLRTSDPTKLGCRQHTVGLSRLCEGRLVMTIQFRRAFLPSHSIMHASASTDTRVNLLHLETAKVREEQTQASMSPSLRF